APQTINQPKTVGAIDTIYSVKKDAPLPNYVEEIKAIEKTPIGNIDHVYADWIKTVQLYPIGSEVSQPILTLQQDYQLLLQFDDLDADYKNYKYRIIHCNADWTQSILIDSDYLEGFTENYITDNEYSFNTTTAYSHYKLNLPNQDVRFTKSGNYIVSVFLDNPKNPIFTKRFFILENLVTIEATAKRATILDDRNLKHEIDFNILHGGHPIENPYEGLHVTLLQNHRWDNAITDLLPLFIKDSELQYNYEGSNCFWAGNEYRYFDSKSMRFLGDRITRVAYDSVQHVFLRKEPKRSFSQYSTEYDINGRYVIRVQEGFESEVEADYVQTHFSLAYDQPILEGDLYIFGALTNWEIHPEAKLKFNRTAKAYETSILLKQGYYNYEYALVPIYKNTIDNTYIEGTHFQTENEYSIFVYNRNSSEQYDRLIGMKQLSTGGIF
ncbi:MAG: hypothetical protein ACI8P7_000974, partial [Candidatus Azotimanducaceae bacterium]